MQHVTLRSVQDQLREIYGGNNEKFPLWNIMSFLMYRATTIFASMEQLRYDQAVTQTAQTFAWVCGVANHPSVDVDLEEEILRRFPGICPYCGVNICGCSDSRRPKRVSEEVLLKYRQALEEPVDIQLMLRRIYPENRLRETSFHMIAEIGELNHAIALATMARQNPVLEGNWPLLRTRNVVTELCDVTVRLLALATLLEHGGVDLLKVVREMHLCGCPECGNKICSCMLKSIQPKKVGTTTVHNDPDNELIGEDRKLIFSTE